MSKLNNQKAKKAERDYKVQNNYKRNTNIIRVMRRYYSFIALIIRKILTRCRKEEIMIAEKFQKKRWKNSYQVRGNYKALV